MYAPTPRIHLPPMPLDPPLPTPSHIPMAPTSITQTWAAAADSFDQYLHDPKLEAKAVIAQIPSLFGLSRKATYLGYRAMGLPVEETLMALDMPEEVLDYWRTQDPSFLTFEALHLPTIQSEVAPRLIQSGFLANMALLVAKDAQIIRKSLASLEELSNREFSYLQKVRTHYTPSDMLALDKALNPDQHKESVSITLSWGGQTETLAGVDHQDNYRLEEGDYQDAEVRELPSPRSDY